MTNTRGKPPKRMTKKEKRKQEFLKMQKKQVEKAFEYPFCRRCRVRLDKEWADKLKKKLAMPLCPTCYKPMMEKFKKLQILWQKFNQR